MKKTVLLLIVVIIALCGCTSDIKTGDAIGKCFVEIDCSTIKQYKGEIKNSTI